MAGDMTLSVAVESASPDVVEIDELTVLEDGTVVVPEVVVCDETVVCEADGLPETVCPVAGAAVEVTADVTVPLS